MAGRGNGKPRRSPKFGKEEERKDEIRRVNYVLGFVIIDKSIMFVNFYTNKNNSSSLKIIGLEYVFDTF